MRTKRGFTLIELLVVISIIALLMAILMPALGRVKKQAQAVMCKTKLRQWGIMFKLYTDANNGNFNQGWNLGETALWMNALRPFYDDNWDMLLCPTAKRVMENDSDWGTFKASWRDVDVPARLGGGRYRYVFSYSINSWTNFMTQDRGDRRQEWFWKGMRNITGGYRIPIFGDSTWHDAWPLEMDEPMPFMDGFGIGNQGTTGEINHFCIDRHNGSINMLFMDLSVRSVGLKELWTLKWHRAFDTSNAWTKAGSVQPEQWPQWLRSYTDY